MKKRKRRVGSISVELLQKSQEAALTAVQIFNNPHVTFKSESFIVLMNIAWTYLFHAYLRRRNIEYRYFELRGTRRKYHRTKRGAFKYWELERCLSDKKCPVDKHTANNLSFLIGIRHEIEHQMTMRLDRSLSAKFQACCLNYNHYVKKLFGSQYGIDQHLTVSLQFTSISKGQAKTLPEETEMPSHIQSFIDGFEGKLSDDEFNSPQYAYRVLYVAKTANRKGQADQVVEFVTPESELAQDIGKLQVLIQDKEKRKYRPSKIVQTMREEGYENFNMHDHTVLWQRLGAKNPGKGYGVEVESTWYWYENWLDTVRDHCEANFT